jgi:hypothetical protein
VLIDGVRKAMVTVLRKKAEIRKMEVFSKMH